MGLYRFDMVANEEVKWDVNCFSYKVNTVQSTGVNSTI